MAKHTQNDELSQVESFESGDFDSILNRSADQIKEPERCPSGRWRLRCTGTFMQATKKEDRENNPDLPIGKVTFYHTPHEPLEGVDPESVEEGHWRGRKIRTSRNIKELGDDAKIRALAEMHGVDPDGKTLKQMLEATKNRFVDGTVSVYSYTNRDKDVVIENQVGNFTRVE